MTRPQTPCSSAVTLRAVTPLYPTDKRGRPVGLAAPAGELDELACRVARLVPSHRDPHRFHADKRDIVAELQRLAAEARRG